MLIKLDKIIYNLRKGDFKGHPFHGNQYISGFTGAKNVKEARVFIEKKLGMKATIPNKTNIEGLNHAIGTMSDIFSKYGKPDGLKEFVVEEMDFGVQGAFRSNPLEAVTKGVPFLGKVVINSKCIERNSTFEQMDKIFGDMTVMPLGASQVKVSTLHELGHAYDFNYRLEHFGQRKDKEGNTRIYYNDPNHHDFWAFRDRLENEEGELTPQVYKKRADVPSIYAMQDSDEFVAESFVQAHTGMKISELQKTMLERITKWK